MPIFDQLQSLVAGLQVTTDAGAVCKAEPSPFRDSKCLANSSDLSPSVFEAICASDAVSYS
jgi:hypothetical protein